MITTVSLLGLMAAGATADLDDSVGSHAQGDDDRDGALPDDAARDPAPDSLIALQDLDAALLGAPQDTAPAGGTEDLSRPDELLFSWLSGDADSEDADDAHFSDADLSPQDGEDLLAELDRAASAEMAAAAAPDGVLDDRLLADDGLADGEDGFSIGDLFDDGEALPTLIEDYDQTADALFVVYDSAAHPDPVLSIGAADSGAEDALISIDGMPLAIVAGAAATLRPSHLSLVPDTLLSDALAAGA
ncbi:hypothetical protein [Rhodovulum visakhapatnamense]|uniref:Uncharacterized protein n=1 Tax=Rhodovulum visakhapatnamense TaxID=364297 RepID=A0A4R8FUX6_9RHOB|nr:hypothetical protein [Rhodovulum visakhapatnamense]TDX30582.1 hypothetical protein EV657_10666 [Rhodovulum visakhapatnamense]